MKTNLTTGQRAEAKKKFQLQAQCAERWEAMLAGHNLEVPDRIQTMCTLGFADDACPIDWERLLAADDYNFSHDISGLDRHMNRETLKLEGFFVPRFALRNSEKVAA
jgi:hypothetical protein